MDRNELSIRFWESIHHLVNREGMRVVYISNNNEEVWLEDDRKKPYQIIKLTQRDFDWSNHLRRSIARTFEYSKEISKKLNLRQANVVNVILSIHTPVDDYESIVQKALPLTAGGKNQFRTILIPIKELQDKMFPLATEWDLSEMPRYINLDYIDEDRQDELLVSLKQSVKQSLKKREEKERNLFLHGKPLFTFLLLGIILAIFAFVEMRGSTTSTVTLIEFGAKFDPLILEGEWWRLFNAMFLHIGFLHLFMNSLALFYLGGAVERIFGTGRFVIIYFIAGFIGSASSFMFNDNVSAGASGAIFGCFGALLYFGVNHKRLFFRTMGMNVIVILIINLGFGFLVPMVDNGAHIGGLIGGFLASAIVGLPKHKKNIFQAISLVVTIITATILLWIGYQQETDSEQISMIYYQVGQEYIEAENYEKALPYLEMGVSNENQPDKESEANGHFLLSYVMIKLDDYENAEKQLLLAIELIPTFHEAYYNLALVYSENGQINEALEMVEKAVELNPDNEDYQNLQDELKQLL
ncbi:rhomboid family intramembrane serine protease [Salipaludibacillus neizhouensis]|nr:rhomboid family intramembrane serine protease [Salipaludibacillus neizhouensis]